jgi:hypothetical protein
MSCANQIHERVLLETLSFTFGLTLLLATLAEHEQMWVQFYGYFSFGCLIILLISFANLNQR